MFSIISMKSFHNPIIILFEIHKMEKEKYPMKESNLDDKFSGHLQ